MQLKKTNNITFNPKNSRSCGNLWISNRKKCTGYPFGENLPSYSKGHHRLRMPLLLDNKDEANLPSLLECLILWDEPRSVHLQLCSPRQALDSYQKTYRSWRIPNYTLEYSCFSLVSVILQKFMEFKGKVKFIMRKMLYSLKVSIESVLINLCLINDFT